jgi:hypothetical protein
MSVNIPAEPNIADARLPATYESAKRALAECSRIDECRDWADKAAAMASYARQARDDTLLSFATRIKARALRRCGELLSQIPPAKPGPKLDDDAVIQLSPREQAACNAGLSERQRNTALRINNIPQNNFEALIEADKPPTATELAEIGKKKRQRSALDRSCENPPTAAPLDAAPARRRHAASCLLAPNLDVERDTLEVKDERTPLPAQDPDGAVPDPYTGWLSQYELVKARQAALAQEQDDICRRYIDLRCRIEEVDRDARRVNAAKPSSLDNERPSLGNTDSVARAAGLSIMADAEAQVSKREAGAFAVRTVMSMNFGVLTAPPAIRP